MCPPSTHAPQCFFNNTVIKDSIFVLKAVTAEDVVKISACLRRDPMGIGMAMQVFDKLAEGNPSALVPERNILWDVRKLYPLCFQQAITILGKLALSDKVKISFSYMQIMLQ